MDGLEKMLEGYPAFLSIHEISEVLRNDVDAIRNRLREGLLPGFQPIGSRWAMAKSELVDYLRSTRNTTTGTLAGDAAPSRSVDEILDEILEPYPNFLNVPEVSEILRIDPAATRVRLKEGTLPGYQPTGQRWIVAKSELHEYLAGTHNSRTRAKDHDDEPDSEDI